MSATEPAPWSIRKCDCSCDGWLVESPTVYGLWFDTHAEALAFVLAQPEVRRRTSSAAKARQRAAEALS